MVSYVIFKGVGSLSAIFAIGVIAVSGVLIEQALQFQRQNSYHYPGHYSENYLQPQRQRNYNPTAYIEPYRNFQNNYNTNYDYNSGYEGRGLSTHDYFHAREHYRYNPVVIISGIGIAIGVVQLAASFFLCCVNENNARPLTMVWMGGHILILVGVISSFALAFYYNVIYKRYYYRYNDGNINSDDDDYYFRNLYNKYYNNNPKGQVFCAILGLDIIFILASLVFVGCIGKRMGHPDDKVWHFRGSKEPPKGNDNDYEGQPQGREH